MRVLAIAILVLALVACDAKFDIDYPPAAGKRIHAEWVDYKNGLCGIRVHLAGNQTATFRPGSDWVCSRVVFDYDHEPERKDTLHP